MSGTKQPPGNPADEATIRFSTSRFGELEVPTSRVITVIGGVIGFPQAQRYVLLEYNPPFSWLQSVDNSDLAFVVVNAAEFGESYRFALPVGDRDLELETDDDVAIVNIVTVRPDPNLTTVNLKAPIIVNMKNMRGRQLVLDNPAFPTRMSLWANQEGDK
jgi:flagellar assembly factor FliW